MVQRDVLGASTSLRSVQLVLRPLYRLNFRLDLRSDTTSMRRSGFEPNSAIVRQLMLDREVQAPSDIHHSTLSAPVPILRLLSQ